MTMSNRGFSGTRWTCFKTDNLIWLVFKLIRDCIYVTLSASFGKTDHKGMLQIEKLLRSACRLWRYYCSKVLTDRQTTTDEWLTSAQVSYKGRIVMDSQCKRPNIAFFIGSRTINGCSNKRSVFETVFCFYFKTQISCILV